MAEELDGGSSYDGSNSIVKEVEFEMSDDGARVGLRLGEWNSSSLKYSKQALELYQGRAN